MTATVQDEVQDTSWLRVIKTLRDTNLVSHADSPARYIKDVIVMKSGHKKKNT